MAEARGAWLRLSTVEAPAGASRAGTVVGVGRPSARSTGWLAAFRATVGSNSANVSGLAQLLVFSVLVVPTWVALGITAALVGQPHFEIGESQGGITIVSALAGEFALGAAMLSFMRAWAARDIASGIAGGGFLAFGVYKLFDLSRVNTVGGQGAQVVGSICLVLALGLVLVSVVHKPAGTKRNYPLTVGVASLLAALMALAVLRPAGTTVLAGYTAAGGAGDPIIASTWAVLGLTAVYIGRSERIPHKIWIGFAALCLAQARFALMLIGNWEVAAMSAAVLSTVAIAIVLFGATSALRATIARSEGLMRQSLLALQGSENQRREAAQAHEEAIHNLRTSLTSIGTATHLLVSDRKVPLSTEERSSLALALQSEFQRACRLLTREWDGGLRAFRLLEVLAPVVVSEQTRGAEIEIEVPMGLMVVGDPERTYEVFSTLFDNARRHAPGSDVGVKAVLAERDGRVRIAVEDHGPGLPAGAEELIFERGWSTSADGVGKGIGLYFARRLMEEQAGSLRAENRSGGGARFVLELPGTVPDGPMGRPARKGDADHLEPAAAERSQNLA